MALVYKLADKKFSINFYFRNSKISSYIRSFFGKWGLPFSGESSKQSSLVNRKRAHDGNDEPVYGKRAFNTTSR